MVIDVPAVGRHRSKLCSLRDWRTVRSVAREAIVPGHPDADVQALIDGKIEVSEYRQRKEKGDAV